MRAWSLHGAAGHRADQIPVECAAPEDRERRTGTGGDEEQSVAEQGGRQRAVPAGEDDHGDPGQRAAEAAQLPPTEALAEEADAEGGGQGRPPRRIRVASAALAWRRPAC